MSFHLVTFSLPLIPSRQGRGNPTFYECIKFSPAFFMSFRFCSFRFLTCRVLADIIPCGLTTVFGEGRFSICRRFLEGEKESDPFSCYRPFGTIKKI